MNRQSGKGKDIPKPSWVELDEPIITHEKDYPREGLVRDLIEDVQKNGLAVFHDPDRGETVIIEAIQTYIDRARANDDQAMIDELPWRKYGNNDRNCLGRHESASDNKVDLVVSHGHPNYERRIFCCFDHLKDAISRALGLHIHPLT